MSSSPVYVLMQPKVRNSYWVANTMAGIDRGLIKYKDKLCIIDTSNMDGMSDLVYSIYKKPVLLVGSDSDWLNDNVNMLMGYDAIPILVNGCMLPIHRSKCSGVVFELEEAVRFCAHYLKKENHDRIAFLGANVHSVSDIAKSEAFGDPDNTFVADGTIEACVDSFLDLLPQRRFNGVICANDTVAIYLINRMRAMGYSLPNDCYVIGMGDSCLGANHTLSVSSIMFNYSEMGEQAVNLYHMIAKSPSPCHHTVSLPCCFIARASTGESEPTGRPIIPPQEVNNVNSVAKTTYFSGKSSQKILELEAILQGCDLTDRQILFGMMRGESNEQIAEQVFLTPRAVRYRINNFFNRNTMIDQNDFFAELKNTLI